MTTRRVLYITRATYGGVGVVVERLAKELDRKRYEPIILFDTFDTHKQSDIRKRLSESDIKTIDLTKHIGEYVSDKPRRRRDKDMSAFLKVRFGERVSQVYLSMKSAYIMLRQIPKVRSFINIIRENEIDLIHTHNDLDHGKPEIVAAWITGIPCISHNHGYPNLTNFAKYFDRFVDSFIYISNDIAKHHIDQGKSKTKGIIIHNGLDMKDFTRTYDTTLVRNELCSTLDEILIGLPGRIAWWKGHEYFLEAIAEVTKKISGLKGVIIGDVTKDSFGHNQHYFNKLQSIVKSLNIEDKILFSGFCSDVPRVLAALDVVVHASSIPEPFGLVIIEGMAAGKPVVATGAGGVLDIIEDGVNGILVPCKDSKAMAKAILQIISDKGKAKQMSLAARQCVANKFTIQRQVTAVQELYDSMFAAPRHR